jgi:hypothetical protein
VKFVGRLGVETFARKPDPDEKSIKFKKYNIIKKEFLRTKNHENFF